MENVENTTYFSNLIHYYTKLDDSQIIVARKEIDIADILTIILYCRRIVINTDSGDNVSLNVIMPHFLAYYWYPKKLYFCLFILSESLPSLLKQNKLKVEMQDSMNFSFSIDI